MPDNLDPLWADLPLDYDQSIEEYRPVPWKLTTTGGSYEYRNYEV